MPWLRENNQHFGEGIDLQDIMHVHACARERIEWSTKIGARFRNMFTPKDFASRCFMVSWLFSYHHLLPASWKKTGKAKWFHVKRVKRYQGLGDNLKMQLSILKYSALSSNPHDFFGSLRRLQRCVSRRDACGPDRQRGRSRQQQMQPLLTAQGAGWFLFSLVSTQHGLKILKRVGSIKEMTPF